MAPVRPLAARVFIVAAIVEACTWALLLIGMYVKYVPESTALLVTIFGALHGAAFIVYLIATVFAARKLRWSFTVTAWALVASIPPFTTRVFEIIARRRGLLGPVDAEPATP